LGDAPETVWAEWYRHLAEAGIPPAARLPVELWTWKVDIRVADLSDEQRLARVELPLPTPGRSSWARFQAVGEELWKEGWAGLVAPSAARAVGLVLGVFRVEQEVQGITPQAPPQTLDDAPVPPTGMTT
jgi:hypothetical protein